MNVSDIRAEINLEFDPKGMPGINEINKAINETIRDLNREELLQHLFITITGTSDIRNIDDIDVNIDDIDDNIDEMGLFKEGFSYDSTNYVLTIPDNIIKIDDLYINDVKQVPASYSRMFNTYQECEDWVYETYGTHYNVPANAYTCFGNKIYFNNDISSDVVKIVCYKEYDYITKTDTLTLPTYFMQYLISSAIVILATRPKNIIPDIAFQRHFKKAKDALNGLKSRLIYVEHKPGLDLW